MGPCRPGSLIPEMGRAEAKPLSVDRNSVLVVDTPLNVVNSEYSVGGTSQSMARAYRTSVMVDAVVLLIVTWLTNRAPVAVDAASEKRCVTVSPDTLLKRVTDV